jgi:hypothetical protein
MLNDEIEKKNSIKKNDLKRRPELTYQICDSGHKTEITL